ncbi:unnamed protein product [Lymnaea stagnalis]|uniref:Phosphatidic acid phosphatase type 2/haloperoxidase domain-containing protein n=1 Tax=Lymnaea stagnalis TaxID=6523 RepID=A0AAV2I7S6_LYMST
MSQTIIVIWQVLIIEMFRQCNQIVSKLNSYVAAWKQAHRSLEIELLLRIGIFVLFIITDNLNGHKQIIQPEEVWLYKYPNSPSIIDFHTLQVLSAMSTFCVIWAIYLYNRNLYSSINAVLGVSLSMYLSLVITNLIKLVVGRPRPDFFDRCYKELPEDPKVLSQANCDRSGDLVSQGYKSFPSGHSTLAFGGMAYLSFYIALNLKVFSQINSQHSSLRLIAFLVPLVVATLVAASRTSDYHHHWQDVLAGSFIGLMVAYMCFRQNFPPLTTKRMDLSHPLSPLPEQQGSQLSVIESHSSI